MTYFVGLSNTIGQNRYHITLRRTKEKWTSMYPILALLNQYISSQNAPTRQNATVLPTGKSSVFMYLGKLHFRLNFARIIELFPVEWIDRNRNKIK